MRVRVYGNLSICKNIIVPNGEDIEEAVVNKVIENMTVKFYRYKFKKQWKRVIESEKQIMFLKIRKN